MTHCLTLLYCLCVCVFSLSLHQFRLFIANRSFTFLFFFFVFPNFTSSLFFRHFSRLLKQWVRTFVPCAIRFSSLRVEDDIATSFSRGFFLCHFFSFSIYIQIHIQKNKMNSFKFLQNSKLGKR